MDQFWTRGIIPIGYRRDGTPIWPMRGGAPLTTAERNNLPDSAFAYIEPGGTKDSSGKTEPRTLRHYPIHDEAHVRDSLSRAAAAKNAGGDTAAIAGHAMAHIEAAAKRMGIGAPAARSEQPMPLSEEALASHMADSEPDGHDSEPAAGSSAAEAAATHGNLHAAGAAHSHPGMMSGRSELPLLTDGSFLVRTMGPEIVYADGESVRAVTLGDTREGGDPSSGGYLQGRFAIFDTWTEVRSQIEGHFMERTGDSAFRKTLGEGRPPIIFNHGWHPQVGTAPIAPTEEIGSDTRGGYYGGPLLKGVPQLIESGLRAGLYGSSYRFRAVKPEINARPRPSDYNPQGIPEVTVREAVLKEIGPGMFPIYKDTSAIVRSETDDYLLSRFGDPEQIRSLLAAQRGGLALPLEGAGDSHSSEGSRSDPPPAAPAHSSHPARFKNRDEWLDYLDVRQDW